MEVTTDYNGVGKIQYLAAQEGIDTLDSQYTDKVVFIFWYRKNRKKLSGKAGRKYKRQGSDTHLWGSILWKVRGKTDIVIKSQRKIQYMTNA